MNFGERENCEATQLIYGDGEAASKVGQIVDMDVFVDTC